jgi:micrococcal nuclease
MLFIIKYVFRALTGRSTAPRVPTRSSSQGRGYANDDRSNGGFSVIRDDIVVSNAYKIKAKSEAEVRARISDLPKAQVVYVKDGDTAVVTIGRDENIIRLDSIDCPEDGQPWGDIAAAGLVKLIGGRTVQLEQHGQDPYGRTLATVYVHHGTEKGWINVNERMVMLGHAWVMRRYYDHLPQGRQQKLNGLERWARSKKVGLWREPNPTPPWKWRNSSSIYPK